MAAKHEPSQAALAAFGAVRGELKAHPDVTDANWFGLPAAKVGGKVFLVLCGEALVAKLGAEDVDRAVAAGEGERFDPSGRGRAMKDWLESAAPPAAWASLGEAALAFVAAGA